MTGAAKDLAQLREQVWEANRSLVRAGLVTLSFGNASGVDRDRGVVVIKPSGVPYDEIRPESLVVVSLADSAVLEGDLHPSSDTPTHIALYRRYPEIGGVVHTHSTEATAWAQALRSIPALGTTHADHFHGPVPVSRPLTRSEIDGDYEVETGKVIVETLETAGVEALEMPGVIVASHGPFTWGGSAATAVQNAIALELVAAMATRTLALSPQVGPLDPVLLQRHYHRKHGSTAYYGQRRP